MEVYWLLGLLFLVTFYRSSLVYTLIRLVGSTDPDSKTPFPKVVIQISWKSGFCGVTETAVAQSLSSQAPPNSPEDGCGYFSV